ncbi:hypothetical protein D3C71_1717110 [compost metagenome]
MELVTLWRQIELVFADVDQCERQVWPDFGHDPRHFADAAAGVDDVRALGRVHFLEQPQDVLALAAVQIMGLQNADALADGLLGSPVDVLDQFDILRKVRRRSWRE